MAAGTTNNGGHDSRAIANCFVQLAREAGHELTILPLIKYIYIAHGWTLGHTNQPLIRDGVQAWDFGPVIPKVYLSVCQGPVIRDFLRDEDGKPYSVQLEGIQKEIVEEAYEKYSKYSPGYLTNITHREGAPWRKYIGYYHKDIPNEEIAEYYRNLVETMKRKRQNA